MSFVQKPERILRTCQHGFLRGNDGSVYMGIRVTEKNELPAALKRLFSSNGPAMLEIITDLELI